MTPKMLAVVLVSFKPVIHRLGNCVGFVYLERHTTSEESELGCLVDVIDDQLLFRSVRNKT